ncbi:MAG: hypothetical protein P8Z42_08545 [Anaerolineales bacterium]|jgi:hypothetical protein
MSTYAKYTHVEDADSAFGAFVQKISPYLHLSRKQSFGIMIFGALVAFEVFNYSTTEFALSDLLGPLRFAGLRWSTILALAFCGMDFAGIARLFTQEDAERESTSTWYLLGAWLIAGSMNAILSWWAVSLALIGHQGLGNEVIGRDALLTVVPIFVAILVWLIRILIIGNFTVTGGNIFTFAFTRKAPKETQSLCAPQFAAPPRRETQNSIPNRPVRPAPKPTPVPQRSVPNMAQRPMAARPARRR